MSERQGIGTMTMADDDLRQGLAAYAQAVKPGDECPSAELLWSLAAGHLGADAARPLIDHLSQCPACAEDARISREMVRKSGGQVTKQVPTSETVRGGKGWLWGLASAAALVVVVLGSSLFLQPGGENALREGRTQQVQSLLPDVAELPRGEAQLRWTGPPEATYDVVVTNEDLTILAAADGLDGMEFEIPAEQVAGLPPGTIIFWQVDAVLADGSRVASPTFRATLIE